MRTPITGASTAIQTYRQMHPDPPAPHLLEIADRETSRAGYLVNPAATSRPTRPRPSRAQHGNLAYTGTFVLTLPTAPNTNR